MNDADAHRLPSNLRPPVAQQQTSDELRRFLIATDFRSRPLYRNYFELISVRDPRTAKVNWADLEFYGEAIYGEAFPVSPSDVIEGTKAELTRIVTAPRPPFYAEYLLHLFLRREERVEAIGDVIESYGDVFKRFDKRHADIWFFKQVAGSLFPLIRRAILKITALAWLGRIVRQLIS